MTEKTKPGEARSGDAWQEVAQRFEALGTSLGAALQQAWDSESGQHAVRDIEAGMRTLARTIADSVDQAAASQEGQELRAEAEDMVTSAAELGRQVVDEAQPQVMAALRSLEEGLQAAADRLRTPSAGTQSPEDSPGS